MSPAGACTRRIYRCAARAVAAGSVARDEEEPGAVRPDADAPAEVAAGLLEARDVLGRVEEPKGLAILGRPRTRLLCERARPYVDIVLPREGSAEHRREDVAEDRHLALVLEPAPVADGIAALAERVREGRRH